MELKQVLDKIGERVVQFSTQIQTEEATKNALIMPFIQSLGYDVFNPLEVIPEYISDIGTKKGEKIDYAILKDGKPIILIECKHLSQNLDIHDGQLLRYFHVSKAKFAILTNGRIYKFYTDLDTPNVMDKKPFLEFDITDLKESKVEEIKKFHKAHFDVDVIINSASDLKYQNAIKLEIAKEFEAPSVDFVKLLVKRVYERNASSKIIDQFEVIVKKAIEGYISDKITDRLKNALEQVDQSNDQDNEEKYDTSTKIITTDEELSGLAIVKAIACKVVPTSRIVSRDAQSYFAILLDDNNRKTICRLYFSGKKKYIGIFDSNKTEQKHHIQNIEDIYSLSDEIVSTILQYLE